MDQALALLILLYAGANDLLQRHQTTAGWESVEQKHISDPGPIKSNPSNGSTSNRALTAYLLCWSQQSDIIELGANCLVLLVGQLTLMSLLKWWALILSKEQAPSALLFLCSGSHAADCLPVLALSLITLEQVASDTATSKNGLTATKSRSSLWSRDSCSNQMYLMGREQIRLVCWQSVCVIGSARLFALGKSTL